MNVGTIPRRRPEPADVPVQLVPVRDTTLAVRIWGEGPPLYLVHGGPGGSGAYWPQVLSSKLAEHHTLVAVDLRGHGFSARDGPYTFRTFGRDLDALAQNLGHPAPALLGHSFGALAGLRAALDHPRFRTLVLVGGFPRTWRVLAAPDGFRTKARLGTSLARWNHDLRRGAAGPKRAFLRALLREAEPLMHGPLTPPWADDVLFASAHDPLDAVVPLQKEILLYDTWLELPRLPARTLLLNGSHDKLAGVDADATARRIPDARLVTIPGAGHSPFLDAPEAFEDELLAFLGGDPLPNPSHPGPSP